MADPPGLLGNLFPGNDPAALYGGALSDPATQAQLAQRGLLAMAGSFADSAMPTRAPIPFGAVLGHAAAAMGPAQDAVMAARLQAAQALQEQALASLTQQKSGFMRDLPGLLQGYYGQGDGTGSPTAPMIPGTIGTPSVATAPHDAGPGWLPGFTIPPNTPTATIDPKLSGTDNLNNLAQAAAPIALPGYTVKMISGERPGAEVAGGGGESQHAKANAADFQIFSPDGKPIDKEGPDTTGAYGKLALTMRMIAPPEMKPWLGWGGNFSTGVTGPADLMHFDWAGDRGHRGTLAQMEQQWTAAQQQPGTTAGGAPPVASAGTTVRGSWFGSSPGWNDPNDKGPQAGGLPVGAGPGIALPIPRDSPNFGGWHYVTAPNGKTLLLQQTDVGPSAKGRGIDVNSVAAQQFGYTPSSFPTDDNFRVQPATGAAPPVRLAQANTGTVTDAAPPGLLAAPPPAATAPGPPPVAPGAAPLAGPPPGALPPGAPPQAPAGPPPSLVTPPPPAPSVPPIARPQVATAPPIAPSAVAPGTIPGAPSPQRIAQAQKIAAYLTMAGFPVPPDIEAVAKFGLVGPTAATEAAAKAPYTSVRPGGSFPVFGSNGQVVGWQTAPMQPMLVEGPPDAQGRPTKRLVYPTTGAEVPLGAAGPSPEETSAGTTRGKYPTAGIPGEPIGPPGAVPQGVDPTKPIPSPANVGRSYQTVIPPITQQARTPDLNTYGQSQPDWQKESGELADAGVLAQRAEANLAAIGKAYQMVESGTWATAKNEFEGVLKSLGMTAPENAAGLAALQTALHNNYKNTLQQLAAANKRFTGNEFRVNAEAGEAAGNQPEANLILLSQDLAQVRQIQALSSDWNAAQTIVGSDGSRWVNPDSFKTAWIQRNPLQPMIDQAKKEIGPLKGMPGWVPPGAPPGTTPTGKTYGGKPSYWVPGEDGKPVEKILR